MNRLIDMSQTSEFVVSRKRRSESPLLHSHLHSVRNNAFTSRNAGFLRTYWGNFYCRDFSSIYWNISVSAVWILKNENFVVFVKHFSNRMYFRICCPTHIGRGTFRIGMKCDTLCCIRKSFHNLCEVLFLKSEFSARHFDCNILQLNFPTIERNFWRKF